MSSGLVWRPSAAQTVRASCELADQADFVAERLRSSWFRKTSSRFRVQKRVAWCRLSTWEVLNRHQAVVTELLLRKALNRNPRCWSMHPLRVANPSEMSPSAAGIRPPSRSSGGSGIEVPEEPVVTSAHWIGCDTVGHQEVGFPPGPVSSTLCSRWLRPGPPNDRRHP